MTRYFFAIFSIILFFFTHYSAGAKEEIFNEFLCKGSRTGDISFSREDVKQIVDVTGVDSRSICSFITLGSHVYELETLKKILLEDKGEMKLFLNRHVFFPKDDKFYQTIDALLFSKNLSDAKQVLNALVLNDLLYGYEVGKTIPLYMQLFLFYATENNSKEEKESLDKILPYIIYIEKQLLSKQDFSQEKLKDYTESVRDSFSNQNKNGKNHKEHREEDRIKDSPY